MVLSKEELWGCTPCDLRPSKSLPFPPEPLPRIVAWPTLLKVHQKEVHAVGKRMERRQYERRREKKREEKIR